MNTTTKTRRKRTRIIDKIIVDNYLFSNDDWRASVICVDTTGIYWELRALSAPTPQKAIANAMVAFKESDWTLYGYTIPSP